VVYQKEKQMRDVCKQVSSMAFHFHFLRRTSPQADLNVAGLTLDFSGIFLGRSFKVETVSSAQAAISFVLLVHSILQKLPVHHCHLLYGKVASCDEDAMSQL
jgi:hypothetical protein